MRMIYGTVALTDRREVAEAETQAVTRMMAALDDCPWESQALRSLPGARSCCTLAVQAAGEGAATHEARTLLPSLGGLTIAADARLDNRAELCAALAIGPDERAGLDDAGLILRAYRQWGPACPEHLLGDFAFALWDNATERLFCARDFIGVRPFYDHHAPSTGRFVCAGGLPAMIAHPAVPTSLNLAYVRAHLQEPVGLFQHPEQTFYREIQKLAPAHCLTVAPEGLLQRAYWQPDGLPERRYADERAYVDELRALLGAAVGCRLESPYPVGAHVSGGLDSSSIAVLAHRILRSRGRGITGISWAPPPPANPAELLPNDERPRVEALRKAEGFPVHYTTLTPDDVLAHVQRDIAVQPTESTSVEVPASQEAAKLGIRTLLSGWGGDELLVFGGRGYLADLLRRGRWNTLLRELALRERLEGVAGWKQFIASGLVPLLPTTVSRHLLTGSSPPQQPLPVSLHPSFAAALSEVASLTRPVLRERPGVRRNQIMLLRHGHLSYRMESWASHGATLGITYLYPLLDKRLVEFALSIPDHLFFRNGRRRALYRTAMEGILPDTVRWNISKRDPATFQALWQARENAAGAVRAAVLARADNLYVDVVRLDAEMTQQWAPGCVAARAGAGYGEREQRRSHIQYGRTGRAVTMVFAALGGTKRPPAVPSQNSNQAANGRSGCDC